MSDVEAETIAVFDKYDKIIEFIKENFEQVEDKSGYVWFSKRNFQIISIETLVKSLEEGWARSLGNSPLAVAERNIEE